MNPWNCREVEAQLDLYAAGVCAPPTRVAVGRHVAACPACANQLREARRLQGLLDLQAAASGGLRRLRTLIDKEDRRMRQPRRILPFLSLMTAAAALVLLTFGLTGIGTAPPTTEPLYLMADARFALEMRSAPAAFPGGVEAFNDHATGRGDTPGLTVPFDRDLADAQRTRNRPLPPAVELSLEMHNNGSATQWLHFEDQRTTLALELVGPGVQRLDVSDEVPSFPRMAVVLRPGATETLSIHRLIAGSRGRVQYLYWTKPGDYTLTVQLRIPVAEGGAPALAVDQLPLSTYLSRPMRIRVVERR